jgi:nitrate reductase gamma subunit
MLLGLIRHVAIVAYDIRRAIRRAGDKKIPYCALAKATLRWLVPTRKAGKRPIYSITTIVFHVSILIVPFFLGAHIVLWARGTGLSWPAIPNLWADILTVVAIAGAAALVIERAAIRSTRSFARIGDYAIPSLIAVPFISGFLVMHPSLNPLAYEATLLVHVVGANAILILIPFSKLSHVILMPLTQLISEVAWHFPPHAGRDVGLALGKENEPI